MSINKLNHFWRASFYKVGGHTSPLPYGIPPDNIFGARVSTKKKKIILCFAKYYFRDCCGASAELER